MTTTPATIKGREARVVESATRPAWVIDDPGSAWMLDRDGNWLNYSYEEPGEKCYWPTREEAEHALDQYKDQA